MSKKPQKVEEPAAQYVVDKKSTMRERAIERRELIEDLKAVAESRRDPRPPIPWRIVKARLGLT